MINAEELDKISEETDRILLSYTDEEVISELRSYLVDFWITIRHTRNRLGWIRGRSSVGRAVALHATGHRFDPGRFHQVTLGMVSIFRL